MHGIKDGVVPVLFNACGSLTDAIFSPVVFFGELITVAEEKLPAPDIENSTNSQVTVVIVLSLNCSSLKIE